GGDIEGDRVMPSWYRPAIHDSHLAVAVVGMHQPTIVDRQRVAAALVTVSYEDAIVARSHVDLDVDSEASARDELERSPPFDRGMPGRNVTDSARSAFHGGWVIILT
ncbi:MAG: hypothetical protein ACO3MX_07625, partial [Candidatus Puniceispirillaceae bacterium]